MTEKTRHGSFSNEDLLVSNNAVPSTGNTGISVEVLSKIRMGRKLEFWTLETPLFSNTRVSPSLVLLCAIGFFAIFVVFFDFSSASSSFGHDALEPEYFCDTESSSANVGTDIKSRRSKEYQSSHQSSLVTWPLASFDPDRSTEENYSMAYTPNDMSTDFIGKFSSLRQRLDYTYHSVYSPARQRLQDAILNCVLTRTRACRQRSGQQFVIFTAGVMGAGKTYTLKWMAQQNIFPINSFVRVDPDQLRQMTPEFPYFVQHDASQAGDRTRKEAGMMSELLTLAALENGQSVIVDGSLRDGEWYNNYFTYLRHHYPGIQITIFHVTAPRDAILDHAVVRYAAARFLRELLQMKLGTLIVLFSHKSLLAGSFLCRNVRILPVVWFPLLYWKRQ
jgi:hypothetical protein